MNTSHETLSQQVTEMKLDHKDGTKESPELTTFLGTYVHFGCVSRIFLPMHAYSLPYRFQPKIRVLHIIWRFCLNVALYILVPIKPNRGKEFGWSQPWWDTVVRMVIKMMTKSGYKNWSITTDRHQHTCTCCFVPLVYTWSLVAKCFWNFHAIDAKV